jgi:hypothetical protein
VLILEVKSTTIFTSSATEFRKSGCKDLRKGNDVKITGWKMSDETITADIVEKR